MTGRPAELVAPTAEPFELVPTSNLELAPRIVHLVETADPHRSILDVGPGFGKYGILLREYLNRKPERLDAIEVEPSYVTPRLEALYDELVVGDVRDHGHAFFAAYDLVLLVDVIEHLEKDEGLELLERIPGRVVVCTPEEFFSNGPGLPDSETHRSLWTRADFESVRPVEVDVSSLGGIVVRLGPMLRS